MIQPTQSATAPAAQEFIQGLLGQKNLASETISESSNSQSASSSGMKQTLELLMTSSSGDPIMDAQAMKMMIALYILQMLLDPGGQNGQQQSMPNLMDSLSRNEFTLSASISQTSQSMHMNHNTYSQHATQAMNATQAYQTTGTSVNAVDTVAE